MLSSLQLSKKRIVTTREQIKTCGFSLMAGSIGSPLLEALQKECSEARVHAKQAEGVGEVSYRSSLAPLGPVGVDLLENHASRVILEPVFQRPFSYCENASCYTYFEEGGYLAPHLDGADDCEVTLLFYLDSSKPRPDPDKSGLYLSVYNNNDTGTQKLIKSIPTEFGDIMVGHGSKVVHGRKRLAQGEHIWMLTACFTSNG